MSVIKNCFNLAFKRTLKRARLFGEADNALKELFKLVTLGNFHTFSTLEIASDYYDRTLAPLSSLVTIQDFLLDLQNNFHFELSLESIGSDQVNQHLALALSTCKPPAAHNGGVVEGHVAVVEELVDAATALILLRSNAWFSAMVALRFLALDEIMEGADDGSR